MNQMVQCLRDDLLTQNLRKASILSYPTFLDLFALLDQ